MQQYYVFLNANQTVTCDFHIGYDSHRTRYRLFWFVSFLPYKNALIKTGNQDIAYGLQQRLVSYSSIAYHSGRIYLYTLALHKP
jgi:hypothetical protein